MPPTICPLCGKAHDGIPDLAFRRPDAVVALVADARAAATESDDACIIPASASQRRRGGVRPRVCRSARSAHAAVLALLISSVLWVTIDLDYPRFGIIQISGEPLAELQRAIAVP